MFYIPLGLYLFFIGFVLAMTVKHGWKDLPLAPRILLFFPALAAFLFDLAFYWVVRVVFFDKGNYPGEWTFSQWLGRKKYDGSWLSPVAKWLCANLLDPFEVGGHCK